MHARLIWLWLGGDILTKLEQVLFLYKPSLFILLGVNNIKKIYNHKYVKLGIF